MLWIQSGHDILAFVWEPWARIICSRKDGKRVNQNVSYSPRLKNVLKELSTGLQLGICWSSTCITTDKSMSSSTLPIRLTVTASHKHYCTRFFLLFLHHEHGITVVALSLEITLPWHAWYSCSDDWKILLLKKVL